MAAAGRGGGRLDFEAGARAGRADWTLKPTALVHQSLSPQEFIVHAWLFLISWTPLFGEGRKLCYSETVGEKEQNLHQSPGDLMNIHVDNLISACSLSAFPCETVSWNINKDPEQLF